MPAHLCLTKSHWLTLRLQAQYMAEVKDIMKTHKTGFMSSFYPIFVQMPVFTGYYFALTMMCSHHLPSMVIDSAAFGFDLTTSDPYHLAPFACSGSMMLAVRLQPAPPSCAAHPDIQGRCRMHACVGRTPSSCMRGCSG